MNRLARAASILSLLVYLSSAPPTGATPVDLTVMTQNLYLGANTDAVLASPNEATLTADLNSIVANKFPTRAGEIAKEAAGAGGPLLIGLQEAYIISAPSIGTLNYTQILLDQLAARGLNYTVAGVHTGFNFATSIFSVTEREVVLARTDVPDLTITGSESHTFQTNVTTSLGPLNRGYALVDATLDGIPFEFVSTHLDSNKTIGEAQAGELLARLGTTAEPQLVVGDFNANPFEESIGGIQGLHAISVTNVGGKHYREVGLRAYEFFFNPMWSCYGRGGNRPLATHYFTESRAHEIYWHMIDQVVLRPSFLPYFPVHRLRILNRAGDVDLVTRSGHPDKTNASDHLPILFRLSRRRRERHG